RLSFRRIVNFGSRSRHHAIESMMVRLSYLALVPASSSDAISWLRPRVHDAASTTIGILPPSLHRSMASAMDFAMNSWPCGYPFDFQGVEQHRPATSGGIHNGFPARSDSVTNASGKDGEAGPSGSRPNIRLMQAGK